MVQAAKKPFDKYWYYINSVQSPEIDVRFIRKVFKELKGRAPESFREDFCGTFALSCEWVKLSSEHRALGVDLDLEPIEYGQANYLTKLKPEQQKRLKIMNANVLDRSLPSADIIGAFNFSYYIFKERSVMKDYFLNCLRTLKKDGMLMMDCFGGTQCYQANEEETVHPTFSYFWDQVNFDPVSNGAKFAIHYKPKGQKKIEDVFTYDWRMWSIPELRDILHEVGFKSTHIYWEGTDKKGEGDGIFRRKKVGEECDSWIAYIVAEK